MSNSTQFTPCLRTYHNAYKDTATYIYDHTEQVQQATIFSVILETKISYTAQSSMNHETSSKYEIKDNHLPQTLIC